MKPLIVTAATLSAFASTSAGAVAQVSPVDRSICCDIHGSASVRFGKNGVNPYFQCSQTGTPWEPLS